MIRSHLERRYKDAGIAVPVVLPFGDEEAEIVLVGEAPAGQEMLRGIPFVGSAGRYLDLLLSLSGINRSELWITNVSKERAPKDKMSLLPKDKLDFWTEQLIYELQLLPNLKMIIPLGNYAMNAITGRWGITSFRGSVLKPLSGINLDCLVLPTIHPSVMNYDFNKWPLIEADLEKTKKIRSKGFNFSFPQFNFVIRPDLSTVLRYLSLFEQTPDQMRTIDVETPHGLLSCIGIGWSRSDAICIPFFWGNGVNYWTEQEEQILWRRIGEVLPLLNLNNQNFLFDWEVMLGYGIRLRMPQWDPMLMHHCLYSAMPHTLDCITSLYTDIPFYKKDERESGDIVKGSSLFAGQEEHHWRYNCTDCVAAWWSIEELRKELVEEKMEAAYRRLYVRLFNPIFSMNVRGIRIDMDKLGLHRKVLKTESDDIEEVLEKIAGHPVNPESSPQVRQFLIDELHLKGYVDRSSGNISMNEENLQKMAHKYGIHEPILIVRHRKIRKELALFSDDNIIDGRVYCQFSAGRTSTGRLSSRKSLRGYGMNLQNVKTGEARGFFVAEVGHKLLGADQMQAEARIVALLARDPTMISVVNSGMIHFKNAETIFGEVIEKDDKRYRLAKALVHGGNYDIGEMEFARHVGCSHSDAKMYLNLYHSTYPGIRQNFHLFVQEEIKKYRTLVNPLGRRMIFFGRQDRETWKIGYAFLPQSTISDINKIALARFTESYLTPRGLLPRLDTHDGQIHSIPEDDLDVAIESLIEAYNIWIEVGGVKYRVPVEISVGDTWKDMRTILKTDSNEDCFDESHNALIA